MQRSYCAQHATSDRFGNYSLRHVARFILLALYCGARQVRVSNATLGKQEKGRSWVDFRSGMLMPPPAHDQTKKRQPPIRLGRKILFHLRRCTAWAPRMPSNTAASHRAQDHGFRTIAREAGMPDIHPHDLRRSVGSWLAQAGVSPFEGASMLGITVRPTCGPMLT